MFVRLLFTGGGGAGSEALWTLLSEKHDLHFADSNPGAIHPIIPASRRHALPLASATNFIRDVRRLAELLQAELVVPGVDEELPHFASARELFNSVIVVPQLPFVEMALDKQSFASWINQILPLSATTRNLLQTDALLSPPVIVKPRTGRGSRGLHLVQTDVELSSLRDFLGSKARDYVQQEYLSGQEYSVQVIVDQAGKLAAIVPVRIVRKRGITLEGVTDNPAQVIETCQHLHNSWPTPGIYNVQGILVADRGFIPFEINPRPSTTLCLAIAAGVDVFAVYTKAPENFVTGKPGVFMHRYWSSHFSEQ